MTYLPHGFSTDFSKADGDEIIVYSVGLGGEIFRAVGSVSPSGRVWANGFRVLRPLCWCPIPTPGDAVLKELAEEGK